MRGHISKHTVFLGRGAFWITSLPVWGCAFMAKTKIKHRLCFQSHTCKLKVLQEVRVELSVRGEVLWAWSVWGHKCLKHTWDRMMFQITNPFNNSKQKYWWCLSFHIKSIQGLALPCGRVYRHIRAHFLSTRTPRKWWGFEEGQETAKRCSVNPCEQTAKPLPVQHFTMLFTHVLCPALTPTQPQLILHSEQGWGRQRRNVFTYSLLWHHYNCVRRRWRHVLHMRVWQSKCIRGTEAVSYMNIQSFPEF